MWMPNVYTKDTLKARIDELNCWLQNHYPAHYLYRSKKQAIAYYTQKLSDLEELKISHISA